MQTLTKRCLSLTCSLPSSRTIQTRISFALKTGNLQSFLRLSKASFTAISSHHLPIISQKVLWNQQMKMKEASLIIRYCKSTLTLQTNCWTKSIWTLLSLILTSFKVKSFRTLSLRMIISYLILFWTECSTRRSASAPSTSSSPSIQTSDNLDVPSQSRIRLRRTKNRFCSFTQSTSLYSTNTVKVCATC